MTTLKMNMPNETSEPKKLYYVYYHRDPQTFKIVYVGKGIYGRAWDVTRCSRYSHEHTQWLKQKSLEGYLPPEWVFIFRRNLLEKEAFDWEREMINYHTPCFNMAIRGSNNHMSKLNEDDVKQIKLRLEAKEYHKDIAKDFNVSRAAISMISTKKNWKHV